MSIKLRTNHRVVFALYCWSLGAKRLINNKTKSWWWRQTRPTGVERSKTSKYALKWPRHQKRNATTVFVMDSRFTHVSSHCKSRGHALSPPMHMILNSAYTAVSLRRECRACGGAPRCLFLTKPQAEHLINEITAVGINVCTNTILFEVFPWHGWRTL